MRRSFLGSLIAAALAVTLAGCTATPQRPVSTAKPAAPKTAAELLASGETTFTHVPGSDCKQCHVTEQLRWHQSLHAASAADVLLNKEHDTAELLTNECIGCHSPFQAKDTSIGALVQPIDQKGPWHLTADANKLWQASKCETCHDVTAKTTFMLAFYDGAKGSYVAVASPTALCSKCHVPGTDDSRDLKGSVHQGLECVACHLKNGMNIDARASCSTCHPKVGPAGHPDVTKLDTTALTKDSGNDIHFVKCKTCHPTGIPKPTKP